MSVSDLSVGCRFADYFAICGLDFDSGLEPDRLCGKYYIKLLRSFFVALKETTIKLCLHFR